MIRAEARGVVWSMSRYIRIAVCLAVAAGCNLDLGDTGGDSANDSRDDAAEESSAEDSRGPDSGEEDEDGTATTERPELLTTTGTTTGDVGLTTTTGGLTTTTTGF